MRMHLVRSTMPHLVWGVFFKIPRVRVKCLVKIFHTTSQHLRGIDMHTEECLSFEEELVCVWWNTFCDVLATGLVPFWIRLQNYHHIKNYLCRLVRLAWLPYIGIGHVSVRTLVTLVWSNDKRTLLHSFQKLPWLSQTSRAECSVHLAHRLPSSKTSSLQKQENPNT